MIIDGKRASDRAIEVILAYYSAFNRGDWDAMLLASEAEIVAAMRMLWDRLKQVVEASGSVPLATILRHPDRFRGKRVGVILSGGNVDLDTLPWLPPT